MAMVNVSEGMILATHIFYLKPFKAIAVSAILGFSLLYSMPAVLAEGAEYCMETVKDH